MMIKKIGKVFKAYAAGGYLIEGSFKLRQQAEAAYHTYMKTLKAEPLATPESISPEPLKKALAGIKPASGESDTKMVSTLAPPNRFKPKAPKDDSTNVPT